MVVNSHMQPAMLPCLNLLCSMRCAPHQLKVLLLMWIQMLQGRGVPLLVAILGSAAKG